MDNVLTLKEAVEKHKLDKRRKWFAYSGIVTVSEIITQPCSGCGCDCSDGYGCNHGASGCHECGYTGKRRNIYPVAAIVDGKTIRVSDPDFTRFERKEGKE